MMDEERLPAFSRVVLVLAAAKTILHFLTYEGYGIFRDEMYFVACARHLSWGFVEHPPLAPAMMALATGVLGDSLFAVRFWPTLLGGVPVVLAALAAREFGGRTYAQILAGLGAGVAPVWMAVHHDFTIVMWEPIFWTAAALVVARMIRTRDPKLWLWFGAICGVGLLNKTSVAVLGFGVVAGLLATKERKLLFTPWLLKGGALAAVIGSPFVIWQAMHGWPQVEFVRNATQFKNIALSPMGFFGEQILMLGPAAAMVWLAGLIFLILHRECRYRALGLAWFIMFAVFIVMHGKAYYLAPFGHVLMGAGAVFWAEKLAARKWLWARAAVAVVVVTSLYVLPLAMPVLSPEKFIEFSESLGMTRSAGERHDVGPLPQHYADMFGWEEMAAEVARVYETLPPEDRARARVFGGNYGEAGAIDYFGPKLGLPAALSGHNSYWAWGYGDFDGEVLILISGESPDWAFAEVEAAGKIHHEYAMPYENDLTVWVCRKPQYSMAELWARVKGFD